MNFESITNLLDTIKTAVDIPENMKRDLIRKVEEIPRVIDTDPWIYRMVVFFLGVTVMSTVIGGIVLTWVGGTSANFQIPQGVVAIGSAAVGALAGLLAPSPRQS
ncbi:MAG: hypothetical protein KA144_00800 [Xanthomonadaceae bacterium]|nr:hypothetical protein [Xanthomonadaceae bacterium]